MKKLYVKRKNYTWWYVAYGDNQMFRRFDHGGWLCLNFNWLRRFWNGCHDAGMQRTT